ncbi:MAG: hypothetical protein EHM83_10600 [Burkholderiales bacterium]|nr:MAG: hypothetical protein EHM83_10600 [Burkholderiales bacterium]
MDTMQAEPATDVVDEKEVFSLPTILDPSAALAAAKRLYAHNRAGLRFFCENRRVVPVDELEVIGDGVAE